MSLLDDFLIRAALAGIGVALAAAPLGCFVVWRRMAYFGDATAHASILGVAIALAFSIAVLPGVLVVALIMAILVSSLAGRGYAMDTLLGVIAHSSLAFGLVAVTLLPGPPVDLMAILIGDVLAVGKGDLAIIWAGAVLVLLLVGWRWRALLTATLNNDLAFAAGIDPNREQLILNICLAFVVAVAIKVVGVLLIAAMLIIPAAAARPMAASAERMAVLAGIIGMVSVLGGLMLALYLDSPAGPTIVCVAAVVFAGSSIMDLASRRT